MLGKGLQCFKYMKLNDFYLILNPLVMCESYEYVISRTVDSDGHLDENFN